MRVLKIFIILNVVTTSFFGCISYPIYDYNYHNYGKIVFLITDWSERGDNIDIPESYTVKIGEYIIILSGTTNPIDYLFPEGKYTINIWNTTKPITVSDKIATTGYTASDPGWFFTGRKEVKIEIDGEHSVVVNMQQQVRQLTFELEIADNIQYRFTSVSATLSGVAGTLNMDNGMHGDPTTIALTFTEDMNDNRWKTTVRLLGVTGNKQTLTLTMNPDDSNISLNTVISDLSYQLASFNEDKKTPLTLIARVEGTQNGEEMITTISDWKPGETSTGEAD